MFLCPSRGGWVSSPLPALEIFQESREDGVCSATSREPSPGPCSGSHGALQGREAEVQELEVPDFGPPTGAPKAGGYQRNEGRASGPGVPVLWKGKVPFHPRKGSTYISSNSIPHPVLLHRKHGGAHLWGGALCRQPCAVGSVIIPILQTRKPRPREVPCPGSQDQKR